MQYCPPPNLADTVRANPMRVSDALRTGIQLASAVETAHRAGILHRDIKPANVLITEYGAPVLTDFGIAGKAEDTADDDVGVSIPWSSPEVLNGASNGSALSDVYSLSATVWHLLVGRSPFELANGDNSQRGLLSRILNNPAPTTGRGDVPPALDRLLQHAMSKDPRRRPRSAFELAQALQTIESDERFARTEIAVLDKQRDQARTPTPSPQGAEPATSLAAPRRVSAQTPVAVPSAPVARSQDPVEPTRVRPTTVVPDLPAAAPTTPEFNPVAPVPMPVKSGARPRQLLLVGGGLVVASVAVAVVMAHGGSADTPTAAHTPRTVVPVDEEPPGTPTVTGTRVAGGVVFSWDYTGKQAGDQFLWTETFPVKGEPVLISAPHASVRAAGRVCITVTVRRPGDTVAPTSDPKCVG
jgi:hypothetical protein